MFSVSDFTSKYETYTDEQLHYIHLHINGYSAEAQQALAIVLKKKGGLENLILRLQQKQVINDEIRKIAVETQELGKAGVDASFIRNTTSSALLSKEQVNDIIDQKYAEVEIDLADKKVTSKTFAGCVIGCFIATLVCGGLWSLQLIYAHAILPFFFVGLVLLCYGIMKLITRQSKHNTAVFLFTGISVILALLFAQLLYNIIGYQG